MACARVHCYALFLIALGSLSALARDQAAAVQSIKVNPGDGGATVEILSTEPIVPQLQTIENPLRLVIDLPNSTLNTARRKIVFRNEEIKDVRMNQYQLNPAVTRIVIDLAAPVHYTWDALGNRLNVRISADKAATAKPVTVPAVTPGGQPVAVPYAQGNSGTLVEAGSRVASGSSITAGDTTSVLRLTRGGEVRVCQGTTLSVATSPNGLDLMLGMNTGAIETHYHLDESSDSILTPDFRVVLPGPGEFNLAVKAEPTGDTCVSSLNGSNASVVVAELLGSGTYELKPERQVLFRKGRMQSVEIPVTPCGCPPAQEPVLRAAADPASVVPENKTDDKLALASSNDQPASTVAKNAATENLPTAPDPAPADNRSEENKAQVSTPLVFSAKEIMQARAEATAALTAEAAALPLSVSSKPADPLPAVMVLPPPETKKPAHRGFFARFFHALF